MEAKTLPLISKADYTNGIWMVFKGERYIIRIWLSLMTGKEIIYVNEDKVNERRNITSFNTVDSIEYNGDHIDVEIDTESLAPIKINGSVFLNGQFFGSQLVYQKLDLLTFAFTEENGDNSQQRMLERYINLGKKELADYDLELAALHFNKASQIDPESSELYYYQACIFSLNEDAQGAIALLEKAIGLGMTGKSRILEEGHLAFVRISPEFEAFREQHL